ncbi:MAG TPA: ArsA-related P-loop ATPase, partial [Acidimicrobiia bacterium]|nr:ArsA-related P-loop ATPase [Acidimicrobiia bacterium]
ARAATPDEAIIAGADLLVVGRAVTAATDRVAAAAAVAAAGELGGRVLVLTIDPARRLADALGLEALGNVERRVPDDALRAAGFEPRGELFAAMLDTKASWDDLVLRHAPDEETAYRVLGNSLYQNITARFVQSHDYIAMERLYDLHTHGRYDLIVVDTPPTRNAIDFLEAPRRMAEFFGGRLLRWLTVPYRLTGRRGARMVNVASRPFYQLADRVLGSQLLQDIAEFFLNFQSMYDGFVARAESVERLLHDRRTSFAVVTTLEGAPLREAELFVQELAKRKLPIGALVLNRVLPPYLTSVEGQRAATALAENPSGVAKTLVGLGEPALDDPARTARVLSTIAGTYRDYGVVAARERELRAELARVPDVLATVPALPDDVHDLAGLARIGRALLATP